MVHRAFGDRLHQTTSGGPTTEPIGAGCAVAATPTDFTMPIIAALEVGSFRAVTGRARCANGREVAYELRDMNGDRQPDLVLHTACDDTTIGPLAWRIHFSTGPGFDANPVRFDLPLPRPPACAVVQLLDVDGDPRARSRDDVDVPGCERRYVAVARESQQRRRLRRIEAGARAAMESGRHFSRRTSRETSSGSSSRTRASNTSVGHLRWLVHGNDCVAE